MKSLTAEIQDLRRRLGAKITGSSAAVKDGEIPIFDGTSGSSVKSSGKTMTQLMNSGGVSVAKAIAFSIAL